MSDDSQVHWTARHGKPIIFVILTLIAVGVYLAFTIPVSVFPATDFPRIVIGVDNGVAPIDQMLVTGHAAHRRSGEQRAGAGAGQIHHQPRLGGSEPLFSTGTSTCSRRCEFVNAALARVQADLASHGERSPPTV